MGSVRTCRRRGSKRHQSSDISAAQGKALDGKPSWALCFGFGGLAPKLPLKAAVTAMTAAPAQPTRAQAKPITTSGSADGPRRWAI
jgi:hypothetical protein